MFDVLYVPVNSFDFQAIRKEFKNEDDNYLRYILAKGNDEDTDLSKTA